MVLMIKRSLYLAALLLLGHALLPVLATAYVQPPRHAETQPYDAHVPHSIVVKLPQAGMDFVAEQLRHSLQTDALQTTIIEALEGQHFSLVMPIFGGEFRVTVPCGFDNTQREDGLPADPTQPWCPYVTYDESNAAAAGDASALPGQYYIRHPITARTDRAFRYNRVLIDVASYPIDNLARPQPNSLFAALYLEEDVEGGQSLRTQLDVIPDHSLLWLNFQVPEGTPVGGDLADCYDPETQVISIHILSSGCTNDFVATLEADLVTGGQLRPYFEENTLFVLVNDFHTRLNGLEIISPFTRNPLVDTLLTFCRTLGLAETCDGMEEQVDGMLSAVEGALGDAAMGLFERELNSALSDVLEDGINQLMFDQEKDGNPDPIVNLNEFVVMLSEITGHPFLGNLSARYESSPQPPAEASFLMDGGIYAGEFDGCVSSGREPVFRYSHLELDGNVGHDPPDMGNTIPGTSRSYEVGASLSVNFINQLLYNAWAAGAFCVTISPHDPAIPPEMAAFLNTANFAPIMRWIGEVAPRSPVHLTLSPREAPYVELGDIGDDSLLRVTLPSIYVDLYVETGSGSEERLLRAFGIAADVTAAVDVHGVQFSGKPLIDLSVTFDSSNEVVFNDLRPDQNQQIEVLIPAVLGLLAPQLAEAVGNLEVPALESCVGGIQQRELVLHTAGTHPETGLDSYLQVFLNFSGYLDFNRLISECLFSTAPAVSFASLSDAGMFTDNAVVLAPYGAGLQDAEPYQWRLNGGFWSRAQRGEWSSGPLLDGAHRVDFKQDGNIHRVAFQVDSSPPVIQTSQRGRRVTIDVIDLSPVRMRVNGGAWMEADHHEVSLSPGSHTLRIEAVDQAGHESKVTQEVFVESTAGCGTAQASWGWAALTLLFLLRFRRRFSAV